MASSTQERFRRDTLPLSPPARSESGSLMVYVPPPAPVALTDLLESFRSALQVADKLPPVLTVRAGDGKLTRRIQVPRLRMFLRYYLNQHICRRLAHLKRAFHADAALGIDRMGELAAIDHFEQAVPVVPVRRIFVWFAVSVVFSAIAISNVAKALAPEPLSKASAALRGSIESIISVDTNGLIDATEKFDPASGVAAVIVMSLALYVISALPITSFRLKRMLLNLTPTDAQKLADTAAISHVSPLAGGLPRREGGVLLARRAAAARDPVRPDRAGDADAAAAAAGHLARRSPTSRALATGGPDVHGGRSTSLVAMAWLFLVDPARPAGPPARHLAPARATTPRAPTRRSASAATSSAARAAASARSLVDSDARLRGLDHRAAPARGAGGRRRPRGDALVVRRRCRSRSPP